MKPKFKDYAGLALLIPVIIAILANLPSCYSDKKEKDCGSMRGYQIELNDSLYIYDGERFVGSIAWPETGKLDSIFLADNE